MTTWLDAPRAVPAGVRLRELLARGGCLGVPGVHDALTALLAKSAGFEAACLSGAALE